MLTTTLRGLERDEFITRVVFPTISPRVDCELTELGRDLWLAARASLTTAGVIEVQANDGRAMRNVVRSDRIEGKGEF